MADSELTTTAVKEYYIPILIFLFSIPALGGFLFGYDIGATSFVVAQITNLDHSGVKWDSLVDDNSSLQGAITSASVFGALLSSILVFQVNDAYGRVTELKAGASLYIVGAFIEALSAQSSFDANTGITILMIGRITYGCGIGIAMHAAPAYIGEMSPSSIRGLMISLKEAMIVLGILMGYMIGFLFEDINGGWRYTYGFAIIIAGPMLLGSFFLKESARWLYLTGLKDDAMDSLKWVLTDSVAEAAFAEMGDSSPNTSAPNCRTLSVHAAEDGREGSTVGVSSRGNSSCTKTEEGGITDNQEDKSIWSKRFRPALIAGVGLVFLQQVTGQPSVLYYAATIFKSAGLATVATVGVAAFKLFMTLITVFTVDKFGRKLLLFVGISVMLGALIALTIGFQYTSTDDSDDDDGADDSSSSVSGTQIVILIAMFIYIGGYQIGFGPIAWLMISEVFPLEVRGQAVALAVQTNFFWNVVTTYLFPVEEQIFGASYTFLIFTIICAYSIFFVYRYVPETKGLTLEQIEVLLGSRKGRSPNGNGESDLQNPLLNSADSVHQGDTNRVSGTSNSKGAASPPLASHTSL